MEPQFPTPLQAGDTIGIIAPSSAADSQDVQTGIQYLEKRGYAVKTAANLSRKTHFLAGPRDVRLRESLRIIQDDTVDAVMCVRGGDGAIHLFPDFLDALADVPPKPLIGYSDITLLQLALYQKYRWVTFSGPMLASDLAPEALIPDSEQHLWDILSTPHDQWHFTPPGETKPEVWHSGEAFGPLLGGCLALVCASLGSPYLPDFTGAILVIEDIDESPRHVDRMLHQLRINGIFDQISGMVAGQFRGCFPDDPDEDFTLREIVEFATRGYDFPILGNFPYGHGTPDRLTIPIGAPVYISTEPPVMTIQ